MVFLASQLFIYFCGSEARQKQYVNVNQIIQKRAVHTRNKEQGPASKWILGGQKIIQKNISVKNMDNKGFRKVLCHENHPPLAWSEQEFFLGKMFGRFYQFDMFVPHLDKFSSSHNISIQGLSLAMVFHGARTLII